MLLAPIVLATTVSFAVPAQSVASLLPQLGQVMGTNLRADRRAGSQVLLVRVRDMSRDRLLKLVAETTGGEWERTADGYRLALGLGRLETMRRQENRARAEWIAGRLADPEELRKDHGRSEDAASVFEAARAVGANALAEVGLGERVVWSTAPVGVQRSLSSTFAEIVRRAEAASREGRAKVAIQFDRPELANGPQPAATALVIARRERCTDRLWITLATYDATGKVALVAIQPFDPPFADSPRALGEGLPKTAKPFPTTASEWANRGRWSVAMANRGLHPEKEEPLALGVGPAIETLADEAKLDLVACLPDDSYEAAIEPVRNGLSAAWASTLGRLGLRSRIEEGTLVLSPSSPWTTVAARTDRILLRRRIAEAEVEGSLNYRFGRPTEFEAAHLMSLNFGSWTNELLGSAAAWTFATVWDSLSDAQRDRALHGGLSEADANGTDLRRLSAAFDEEGGGAASRLDEEPTALGANPRPAVLIARSSTHAAGVYRVVGAVLPFWSWNLDALAALLATPNPSYPPKRPDTRFWPSDSTTILMHVEIGGHPFELDFSRYRRECSAGYVAPDYFPALRALIQPARGG